MSEAPSLVAYRPTGVRVLAAVLVADVLLVGIEVAAWLLRATGSPGTWPDYRAETAGTWTSVLSAILYVAAIVAFFFWLGATRRNLAAIGRPASWSGFWTYCGWFVPLAGFIVPYLVVRDLWKRAAPRRRAWPVAAWWLAWAAHAGMLPFAGRFLWAPVPEALWPLVHEASAVPAAGLVIVVTLTIDRGLREQLGAVEAAPTRF